MQVMARPTYGEGQELKDREKGKDLKEREAPRALSYDAINRFKTDPAAYLTEVINEFVETSPLNWAAPFNHPLFRTPVAIAFGDGDSPEFLDIKKKYPYTLTPREWMELALNAPMPPIDPTCPTPSGEQQEQRNIPMVRPEFHPDGSVTWPDGEPPLPPWEEKPFEAFALGIVKPELKNVTCISIGLPVHPKIVHAECNLKEWHFLGSPEYTLNSRVGAHGGVLATVAQYVDRLLQWMGHATCVPYLSFWYGLRWVQQYFQYAGPTSRTPVIPYPDRLYAVAAGLGTFGINDMVITKEGMAVYLVTVFTDAKILPTPKPTQEYCLWYRNKSCSRCVDVCPTKAIYTATPNTGKPGRLAARCHMAPEAMVHYKRKYLKDKLKQAFGDWAEAGNMNFVAAGGASGTIGEYSACGQCMCNVPCATEVPE